MDAIKRFFQLNRTGEWKAAYIEVKSTSGPERYYFHLSDAQFERVYPVFGDG
jgi:hypothetical protein